MRAPQFIFYISLNAPRDSQGSFSLPFPLLTIALKLFSPPEWCCLNECTVHLFPPPQWAAVKSSSSRRLRTIHRGEDPTYGKPRWCSDGSLWYVWHKQHHTGLHMNSEHPAASAPDGVCWRQTSIVWLTGGVFSQQAGTESKLLSVFRESDRLLSATELHHSRQQF